MRNSLIWCMRGINFEYPGYNRAAQLNADKWKIISLGVKNSIVNDCSDRCCSKLTQEKKKKRSYWRKIADSTAKPKRGNGISNCCCRWRGRAEDLAHCSYRSRCALILAVERQSAGSREKHIWHGQKWSLRFRSLWKISPLGLREVEYL